MTTFHSSSAVSFDNVDYRDNAICLVSNVAQMLKNIPQAILMEEYVVVLVLKGHATIQVEGEEFQLSPGHLFICLPQVLLKHAMVSMDIEVRGFSVSRAKAEELLNDTGLKWNFILSTKKYDLVQVNQKQKEIICLYYDLLRNLLPEPSTPLTRKSLHHIFSALVYAVSEVFQQAEQEQPARAFTSAENIFQRFATILEDPTQPLCNVSGYAERLNITPKYFSMICKELSGQTAKALIIEETIKRAKILLRNQSLSVKQVADCLGFQNQSHFGTYFHRHMGLSPQQFRRAKGNE